MQRSVRIEIDDAIEDTDDDIMDEDELVEAVFDFLHGEHSRRNIRKRVKKWLRRGRCRGQ